MNKNIYLCKEGDCGKVDLNFIYPDWNIKFYGLCCKDCVNRKNCSTVCDVINHKRLKVEECNFRKSYKEELEKILDKKREDIVHSKIEISKLEKEIADIEGRLNIKSPLICHVCGSEDVEYDTTKVLLSCPPKYIGKCKCGTTRYVDVNVYRNNKEVE